MFSPSDFRDLFQPNYCERRVWLAANQPELAAADVEFSELVITKGQEVEESHVQTVGPVERPDYEPFDMPKGFEETLRLIKAETPIVYQGVLMTEDKALVAIPDLLILDKASGRYRIRDVKLAVNLENHPEIEFGLGLCKLIAEEVLGYPPIVEVVTGDGEIVSPFPVPDKDEVREYIDGIVELWEATEEPFEPVGWSKCSSCAFFGHCWTQAWENHDVCTISGIEQGMSRALHEKGIRSWHDVVDLGPEGIAEVVFPRGRGTQRIGPTRGPKIVRQARCLVGNTYEVISPLALPHGYSKGTRPVAIFDIENNIFEIGIRVNVYLWGLMVVSPEELLDQKLVLAPTGDGGDAEGWRMFLATMADIFSKYGDIPLIHYSRHEKTWVTNYIDRYGDIRGVGEKVLENLWDMYSAITSSVALPVPSYSLKQIEHYVDFKRTQEEYGGSWSIVRYNQYLQATREDDANRIINEIQTYNREDLLATYSVYKWLEENCC